MATGARKRALITGGTRGIGAAVATALVRAGYEVAVTGTTPTGKAPQQCAYIASDFSQPGAVEALEGRAAQMELAVLVNNAGINRVGSVAGYDRGDFELIQRVNVHAPFLLCRAVVPGMCRRKFGRILNITSVFGVVSRAGRSAYSASKFALFGLSRALALEVAGDNVLVNCLAPGFVETDMTRSILGAPGMAEMAGRIPIGRLAQPEEIARYARFLVSDDNTYMTGQMLIVDGGFTSE